MNFRIKPYRKALNLTHQELADKSGISRTTISGLETGLLTVTSTATLERIAAVLEVSLKDLMED